MVLTLLDIVSTSIKDSQGQLGLVGELMWRIHELTPFKTINVEL